MASNDTKDGGSGTGPALVAGLALGIGALAIGLATRGTGSQVSSDDAPGRTARKRKFGKYTVVGKTVTIGRPRAELFAYWRDFQNLPSFMENVESVQPTGNNGRSAWTIKGPAGPITFETEIVEEREGELIAWRSVPGAAIDNEGRVTFRDAQGGRGTEVAAIIAYVPPAGALGRAVATLFQREPAMQARRELRRFRMLMETGEIANSATTRAAA